MVDAAASFDGNRPATTEAAPCAVPKDAAELSVSVVAEEGLAAYAGFCGSALYAPAQGAVWVQNWTSNVNPDLLIATLTLADRPVFALALEIARRGPFRIKSEAKRS